MISCEYKKNQIYAKFLASALVLMYGLVPFLIDMVGMYDVAWAEENLKYSLVLVFIVLSLPTFKPKVFILKYPDVSFNLFVVSCLFLISAIIFFNFPWHEDRVSMGSRFAAMARAIWVVLIVFLVKCNEFQKLLLLILTAALVFIDESRTYFLIAVLLLSLTSKYKYIYGVMGFLAILVVAAVRVDEGKMGMDLLLYGIIGEGYNGAKPIGQVLSIDLSAINSVLHMTLTIFQPIVFPVEFLLNRILSLGFPTQDSEFAVAVANHLGERLSPMGGWYILADFIAYGPIGMLFLYIYVHIMWLVSNLVLNNKAYPVGALFFIIGLKATPYVYYKFVFYFLFFYLLSLTVIYTLKYVSKAISADLVRSS